MGEIIFHLALADDWTAARRVGEYRISTRGQSLDAVGFIHCSRADQAAGVARRYFAGAGPLVRLYIDRDRVAADVIDDEVPGGERFPHIYGPLGLDAVIATSATDAEAAADDGWAAAPAELVVGVTGHRQLADPATVAAAVDGVCRTLASRSAAHGWRLVSTLAEGAGRLVARAALSHGAELDAVLPLDAGGDAAAFADAASRAELDELLARAESVTVTGAWPDGSRDRAEANARTAMLGRVGVVVALWDGRDARGPGGPAEVVAAAARAGLETIVVPVRRPER